MITNLDLHLGAAKAAQDSIAAKSQFQADAMAQQAFTAQKQNELDWPAWKNYFDDRRKAFLQLAATHPQSVIAEQRAKGRVLPPAPAPQPPTATK